jgi:REP element-mobilizing transposase RayT
MARAKRHYIPGYVWHITHRCHKKEFLLKFARDKRRWLHWLFEAKKRYGLVILDYMVTSNHIHLLVVDDGDRESIPKSLQLVAGRTAQEYNQRKDRLGAFWQDRYHATAVETDEHLHQCIAYIDLNMVRAGVVDHPSKWPFCGYNEIQNPRERYGLINYNRLLNLVGIYSYDDFKVAHRNWAEASLVQGENARDSSWTEAVAVGSKKFVEKVKERLMVKVRGRHVCRNRDGYELRESIKPYSADFGGKKSALRPENAYFWDNTF